MSTKISLLFCLLAVLFMASCGGKKQKEETLVNTTIAAPTAEATPEATETTAAADIPEAAEATAAEEELRCDFTIRGEGPTLGTWVWDAREIVKNKHNVLDFLVQNNVSEVYLGYNRSVFDKYYRAFVREAHALGIRSAVIGADANWVLPEGRHGYEGFVTWYEAYQKGCESEAEQFYGMHMDVEPHQLAAWSEDNQRVVDAYADWARQAREDCTRLDTLLELDIPVWFNGFTLTDSDLTLEEFCFTVADTVLLMDYRQSGQVMFQDGKRGLALGQQYGVKTVLASETGHVPEEPMISFYRMGKRALYREMAILRGLVDEHFPQGDIGYAIHWFYSWYTLPADGHP